MQQTTQQGKTQKKGIQSNLDFDLDDFDFKPVTKGLGFHHNEETEKTVRSYQRPQAKPVQDPYKRESVSISINQPRVNEPTKALIKEKTKKKSKTRSARMGMQFTGFIFDLIILISIQISLNYVFLKIVGLSNFSHFLQFTIIEQTLFFAFIFLFYFTLMDLTASPGKRILSMRLNSLTSKKVSIDQTLIRSVVTLLSFLTMGMPLLFDFQGKLSDTKLIEDV